ncbi:uncharacterized protein LOC117939048 [Etheostoma cragini]|uniref:uncharacterized protein LOC117939048 n=1 Tax=Etheostoma cragini TaxID=417921 RepID=UPI00155ED653|nr:uncharacterized protein LOC117939048 [Etheostoma cragini]
MLTCKVDGSVCRLWSTSLLLVLLVVLVRDLSGADLPESQPVPCNISVSDPVLDLDSISLTVTTPGGNCSFTVTSPDAGTDGAECSPRRNEGKEEIETSDIRGEEEAKEEMGSTQLGEEDGGNKELGGVFTCTLEHLEPGTVYLLQIQSQRDEETANITLHTRKSSLSPDLYCTTQYTRPVTRHSWGAWLMVYGVTGGETVLSP